VGVHHACPGVRTYDTKQEVHKQRAPQILNSCVLEQFLPVGIVCGIVLRGEISKCSSLIHLCCARCTEAPHVLIIVKESLKCGFDPQSRGSHSLYEPDVRDIPSIDMTFILPSSRSNTMLVLLRRLNYIRSKLLCRQIVV